MTWYLDPQLRNCRRIFLKNIRRNVRIGAYDHEKSAPQPVVFNVEVFVNTHDEDDRLDNAYNYDTVIRTIDHHVAGQHIVLQETLVEAIAQELLQNPRVVAVVVRSEKTKAYETAESAGVEIFRKKN